MHKDFYQPQQPKLYLDLNPAKLLAVVITLFAFFVIPAQLGTIYKNEPDRFREITSVDFLKNDDKSDVNVSNNSGRVAGVNSGVDSSNGLSSGINLNFQNQSTQYAMLGVFFLTVGVVALGYLIQTEREYKTRN